MQQTKHFANAVACRWEIPMNYMEQMPMAPKIKTIEIGRAHV